MSKICLQTLLAQNGEPDILIVDNASTDGTATWAKSMAHKHQRISRITFEITQSVSTLWNNSLRLAWTHGYEDALVVNNDTELLPETYETLHGWAMPIWDKEDGSESGMVTCVSRRSRSELVYEGLTSRNNPDFSCFLIRRWAFEAVNGFDEGYEGAYGEDCDFHVRLHDAGIRAVCISLPFLHHGSGTLKHADIYERKRITLNAEANRKRFFQSYGRHVGTNSYDDLFTEATFGVKRFVRSNVGLVATRAE